MGMQQILLGAGPSGHLVEITNASVDAIIADTAKYKVASDGKVYTNVGPSDVLWETWRLSGASADYEVRATLTSGSVSSGTTGSWLALSTTREWTRGPTIGFSHANLTIEIRLTGGALLDSAEVSLTQEPDAG